MFSMLFGIVGIFLILFWKKMNYKWMVHTGWFLAGFLTFSGMLCGIFLIILGGGMQDLCNLLDTAIVSTAIGNYPTIVPADIQGVVDKCFFKTGQMEEMMALDDEQVTLEHLRDQMNIYSLGRGQVVTVHPQIDAWITKTDGFIRRPSTADFYQNPIVVNPSVYLLSLTDRTD
jgi:hypothetical protein